MNDARDESDEDGRACSIGIHTLLVCWHKDDD